jgi:hypothetical protein
MPIRCSPIVSKKVDQDFMNQLYKEIPPENAIVNSVPICFGNLC